MTGIAPRDRLIVALDVPTVEEAEALVASLGDGVTFYKVGLELVYGGGLPFAARLIAAGKQVFLDLKLHDIPNTVTRATAQIAKLGARFLTIHAYPQTMAAAVAGAAGTNLQLLAVTVLTSADDADLAQAGYASGTSELVARRAGQASTAGIPGLILSPMEVAAMRQKLGPAMLLVTPGIRRASTGAENSASDQKRIMTPSAAIAAGADYLVVGRPVTQAADPLAAAAAIVADIAAA